VDAGDLTRLAAQLRRTLADVKRKAEAATPAPRSFLEQLTANGDDAEGD
jgi:hypothetical protein